MSVMVKDVIKTPVLQTGWQSCGIVTRSRHGGAMVEHPGMAPKHSSSEWLPPSVLSLRGQSIETMHTGEAGGAESAEGTG